MKSIIQFGCIAVGTAIISSCGPSAADYYTQGIQEVSSNNCGCVQSFKSASDMELEDEGKWYPIYLMSLGYARYHCNDLPGALRAFRAVDQYAVLRSEISGGQKTLQFVKSKSKRLYELKEREETLLHYYLGMIYYRQGNYKDALIEFKKVDNYAEGVYSQLPLIALVRGLTYQKLGDADNALVAFKKIIEQNPKSPVGYQLAFLTDQNVERSAFYQRELKQKCGVDFQRPGDGQTALVVLVECKGTFRSNRSLIADVSEAHDSLVFLDPVQPDFNFSAFIGGQIKELASKVARDAAKDVASNLVPGGGLIAGMFLGGDEEDARTWMVPPDYFVARVINVRKEPKQNATIRNKVLASKGSLFNGFQDTFTEQRKNLTVNSNASDILTTYVLSN